MAQEEQHKRSYTPSATTPGSEPSRVFHIVLLKGFASLSLHSALDTLQNANLVAGKQIYDWCFCGLTEAPVISSIGHETHVDTSIKEISTATDIVIVAGEGVFDLELGPLKVWLSRLARGDVRVAGLGSGAIVMASAGLLNDVPAAVNAWYHSGFEELFPTLELSRRTHVSEGLRCSSAGGVSGIDLFLDFIALDHGERFSDLVAESMCYTPLRQVQKSVDITIPNSLTVAHPIVSKVIAEMERTIDEPVSPARLAENVNMSTRQLERLFNKYLGTSPKRHYTRLRLREAYRLLVQSHLPVIEIALSTGFTSTSHFSKCFRAEFGSSPYELRGKKRNSESGSN
ncbi:HTH-type transcriptional regulator CdhR [Roseovarius albus]|uniref:HTH-type transcriptional regulator CdhR n=1 Tax=Roseovarius albus TaxID=1247867 RepID=A0A1X6ZZU4_9RHOB|nr:HTH-type transcriptional regulator CdhR [Roseovarius albus]